MRNIIQYPVLYDEAIETLVRMREESMVDMACGDMRPVIIQWTIDRLSELRKMEDHFDKLKHSRMPNRSIKEDV